MSLGIQCDTCRIFTPSPAAGWLHVVRRATGGHGHARRQLGAAMASFCSMLCLAQYAMARTLVEGRAAGEEPL